jgi:glycosyltransferase involved in cell wall biosynthesis
MAFQLAISSNDCPNFRKEQEMNAIIITFFTIYSIVLFLIIGIGFYLQQKKEKSYRIGKHINCADITLIVPFRNEEKRIEGLIQSLLGAKKTPSKVIFIDDHSTDSTVQVINAKLHRIPFQIIDLPNDIEGKKHALRYGINHSDSTFILCMDADVSFASDYFEQLETLSETEMYLLPATLIAKRNFEHFFEIDLLLVNALNAGMSGLFRPVVASGANLFFKKESFLQVDKIETHVHIPSGDDIYLLRDFREAKCDVRLVSDIRNQVTTETPQSFNEFMHQRIRWISKTGHVKDNLSTFLAIFQLILTLGFIGILIFLFFKNQFQIAIAIFCLKTGVDMLLFFRFFKQFKRTVAWFLIPLYQLIFPVYNLILLLILPFFKPKWKGRYSGINHR